MNQAPNVILYTGLTLCDYFVETENIGSLIEALGILCSFITTLSATSLIALKIVLVTRQSHMRHSYSKIIEILVQSAAIVSIVLFGMAVLILVSRTHPWNLNTTSGRFFFQLGEYLIFVQLPVSVRIPGCFYCN